MQYIMRMRTILLLINVIIFAIDVFWLIKLLELNNCHRRNLTNVELNF